MGWLEPGAAAGNGYPVPGDGRERLRAADADRDRVAETLGTAYSEGRLSRDEYDARLEKALSARTYADLDQVVSDLPGARAPQEAPVAKTNALAGLVLGWAMVILGIAAIIVGLAVAAGMRGSMGMHAMP